ncbi:HD domain-containing protein [Nocardia caishijiensis]|uniref:Metal-dependent HD superfamily phosphohydrolase n=1 Tax=Nocardia caishijiensis TaxID=184756 RepID=A0ABQ6YQH1_9NOCA|nr:metal-dependent phosphohydrolase [Nocardia caishijiensis]KAF0847774.1 putative metal-dependent HD superfamily phosphohydrolase [Nocardia caishijiensis]
MSVLAENLLDRWIALAPNGSEAIGAGIIGRYAEPHRRYHTLTHLSVMLAAVDELAEAATDIDAVRYAAFFHDAIYAVDRADNEERSADLARDVLESLGAAPELVDEVVRLVILTRGHNPEAGDANGAVLCDADLVVLGGTAQEYATYAAAIRDEYRHVPDDLFRAGRASVLRNLAEQPRLFRTARAYQRYEAPARANLAAELIGLSG